MVTDNSETMIVPSSTMQPGCVVGGQVGLDGLDVRHAMVVINRMIRSSDKCDEIVHDRLDRAVGILQATRQTETAFVSQKPADVVFRLAARVMRGIGLKA